MTQRIFLQKTPKEDREKNEKLPYFKMVLIPEKEGGEWEELGAFWPSKNGTGYSGKLQDGVKLDTNSVVPYKAPTGEDTRQAPTPDED